LKIAELLERGPLAINVGLRDFAHDLEEQQVEVIQLEWRPPTPDDDEMKRLLEKLL
jgi:hypothetical protein